MCAACMSYTNRTLPDSEILTKSTQFRWTDSEDFCCCLVLPEEKKLSHGTVMVERVLLVVITFRGRGFKNIYNNDDVY